MTLYKQAKTRPIHQPGEQVSRAQNVPTLVTLLILYEIIDVCTVKHMDHSTLYRLKNHMTLSLFLVKSVKCDFYTIRDISIHFTYGKGSCTSFTHLS